MIDVSEQQFRQILTDIVSDIVDKKLDDKLEHQANWLMKYFNSRLDNLERRMEQGFAEVHADIDRLYNAFDGHEKRIETLEHEQMAIKSQLGRHDLLLGAG